MKYLPAIMLAVPIIMLAPRPSMAQEMQKDYPIRPVPFTDVQIGEGFWAPRMEANTRTTVPFALQKCEDTGRIDNFAKAGGLMEGPHEGHRYNDSDVFKIIEGAAYTLALGADADLETTVNGVIEKIAAAQEDDGYLFTTRTIDPEHPAPASGPERWSYLDHSHELYNVGHLYEAAVAWYQATGNRNLLEVALKNAELIDQVFGPDKRSGAPGHQEIEIGLGRLYRLTGEDKYLRLARFFLDERGQADRRKLYGAYSQDHLPVVEQTEAVGHAVRALYMYSGMADVAALTGDPAYLHAIKRIWNDVVAHKTYVTGGVGARHSGEAFGEAYELPNQSAYNETCAAIASIMWNHRLFLLEGDGRYMDVVERTLYNGFLAGVSFGGDLFFYPNPLEADGRFAFNQGAATRQPWFDCACCPSNVARFMPSIPGYAAAWKDQALYVSLYLSGQVVVRRDGGDVTLDMATRYPWDGQTRIRVEPAEPGAFPIYLRIPGWARNEPLPGGLYQYLSPAEPAVTIQVNNEYVEIDLVKGYAVLRREWKSGDVILLNLPMSIRRVVCDERVENNRGRVALERGPIVYCVEGVDHQGHVRHLFLPDDAELGSEFRSDLLNGVEVIKGTAGAAHLGEDRATTATEALPFLAVPYYAWSHRGVGEMAVWLPRQADGARSLPPPTLASRSRVSASHCWGPDTIAAVNDQTEPRSSGDQTIPRLTWWDHRGTTEWVQYDLPEKATVSAVGLYWFDDTGHGYCRVPQSWRLQYRVGDDWRPVENADRYGVEKDRFNETRFAPVETDGLRVEAQLQPEYSGGVLEWVIVE